MNKENDIITLKDMAWYEAYGIQAIKSMKAYEAYYYNADDDSLKIEEDWGSQTQLQYDYICHKTFCFLLLFWIDISILKRCLVNIEKLYLLHKLGGASLRYIEKLIKSEGAESIILTKELVEDIAALNPDEELEKQTKGKKIYFFQRAGWGIIQRESFNPNDATVRVRARFNFLVLDRIT